MSSQLTKTDYTTDYWWIVDGTVHPATAFTAASVCNKSEQLGRIYLGTREEAEAIGMAAVQNPPQEYWQVRTSYLMEEDELERNSTGGWVLRSVLFCDFAYPLVADADDGHYLYTFSRPRLTRRSA